MSFYREFAHYVAPSVLAFALSGVYAITDGFFVGNALGDEALAAINVAYPLTAFLQSVGTGVGLGGAISYAIRRGGGDEEGSRRYFGVSVVLLLLSSALLTGLYLWKALPLLSLFGAEGAILDLGWEYIRCIALGALFQILATGLVPFLRNMGGTVAAMASMITGFVTNVVLDYLFVWVLPWGMTGAAAATVIGQAMTFLVCLGALVRRRARPAFPRGPEALRMMGRVLLVGLSPFGLTFSPNITLILVNKSAAVFGGAFAVMVYAPISYLSSVILLLLQGVSDGCQPLLSLSYGRGEKEKARRVRELAHLCALVLGGMCMVLLYLLRGQTALLFGASPAVAEEAARVLPIFLSGYLFLALSRVTTAYLYATNQNRRAYALIYGEPLFLAVLLLILPAALGGVLGTWWSIPLSQMATALLSLWFLRRERRPAPAAE